MSKRWYLETSASGQQQFVSVKRTRSTKSKHHHHHHHEHGLIKVNRAEWNALVERERKLGETNTGLVAENTAMKANLSAVQAEAHQLQTVVMPQLQSQIGVLVADNESLRRSIDNAGQHSSTHFIEEERLRQKIDRLERDNKDAKEENCTLRNRVATLSRQLEQGCNRRATDLLREVDYWKDQCKFWKGRFEDTKKRHDDTCGMLDIRTEKMQAYEEILKRRRII